MLMGLVRTALTRRFLQTLTSYGMFQSEQELPSDYIHYSSFFSLNRIFVSYRKNSFTTFLLDGGRDVQMPTLIWWYMWVFFHYGIKRLPWSDDTCEYSLTMGSNAYLDLMIHVSILSLLDQTPTLIWWYMWVFFHYGIKRLPWSDDTCEYSFTIGSNAYLDLMIHVSIPSLLDRTPTLIWWYMWVFLHYLDQTPTLIWWYMWIFLHYWIKRLPWSDDTCEYSFHYWIKRLPWSDDTCEYSFTIGSNAYLDLMIHVSIPSLLDQTPTLIWWSNAYLDLMIHVSIPSLLDQTPTLIWWYMWVFLHYWIKRLPWSDDTCEYSFTIGSNAYLDLMIHVSIPSLLDQMK